MGAPASLYDVTRTVSTVEYSLPLGANYSSGSPVATDCGAAAFIKILSMAAGDAFDFKVYEKCISSSSAQTVWEAFTLAYPNDKMVLPMLPLLYAWDITAKRIAGADRSIEFSMRGYT